MGGLRAAPVTQSGKQWDRRVYRRSRPPPVRQGEGGAALLLLAAATEVTTSVSLGAVAALTEEDPRRWE